MNVKVYFKSGLVKECTDPYIVVGVSNTDLLKKAIEREPVVIFIDSVEMIEVLEK